MVNRRSGLRTYLSLLWNRLAAYLCGSVIFILAAQKDVAMLAALAYVIAGFALVATLTSMPLVAIGNLAAQCAPPSRPRLFQAGWVLALGLAVLAGGAGALQGWLDGRTLAGLGARPAASVYVWSLPLLVLNTFLMYFHEATDAAAACSRVMRGALGMAMVGAAAAFFSLDDVDFLLAAAAYFVVFEALAFMGLLRLAVLRGLPLRPVWQAAVGIQLLRLGGPIALGLAAQKLYYYLLNQHLYGVAPLWLAYWSALSNISGLLILPFAAYAQACSLRISARAWQPGDGRRALAVFGLLALLAGVVWAGGARGLLWVFAGARAPVLDMPIYLALFFALLASASLGFALAALRAWHDSLLPQVTVAVALLAGVLPVLPVLQHYFQAGLAGYLFVQGAVLGLVALLLHIRLWRRMAGPGLNAQAKKAAQGSL